MEFNQSLLCNKIGDQLTIDTSRFQNSKMTKISSQKENFKNSACRTQKTAGQLTWKIRSQQKIIRLEFHQPITHLFHLHPTTSIPLNKPPNQSKIKLIIEVLCYPNNLAKAKIISVNSIKCLQSVISIRNSIIQCQ